MQDRGHRQPIFYALLLCLASGLAPSSAARGIAAAQRVGAPAEIPCSRDHLTLYNGRVLGLSRSRGRTTIRIRTDYQTTERVSISHTKSGTPLPWFRLHGEAFRQSDWGLIESARNRLKRGMRANIWVCDDGSNPIVDWQPPK
jgi:hypothetical protein